MFLLFSLTVIDIRVCIPLGGCLYAARPLIVVRLARLGRTYNRDLLGQVGAHFGMSNRVWNARSSYICECIMMNRQRERG